MKHKKGIMIGCAFIASMGISYLIGQHVVLPMSQQKNIEQNALSSESTESPDGKKDTADSDNVILYNFVDNMDSLEYQNKEDTSDNPWGSTISRIEDDTVGTSILMTPNTYMSANYHVNGNEKVVWNYNIHPSVAEVSDGLTMHVRVYQSGSEEPAFSKDYEVTGTKEYQTTEFSLKEFKGQDIKITFSVGNGANNNSDGDWLVLNKLRIESMPEEEINSTSGDARAEEADGKVTDVAQEYISFTDDFEEMQFENKAENTDNPWGSTINNMLTEQDEKAIVMLPYTAMKCTFYVSGNETMNWYDSIHPWVAEVSDGMDMEINVYEEGVSTPSLTKEYSITKERVERTLDLQQFKDKWITLEVKTVEPEGADTSGDWLFLEKPYIMSKGDTKVLREKTEEHWEETNIEGVSFLQNFDALQCNGRQNTEDNPWGSTICIGQDEQNGEFLFMVPNTSVSYSTEISQGTLLKGKAKIHSAVSNVSDGVNVFVNVYDDNNEVKKSNKFVIKPGGETTEIQVDFGEFSGQKMRIEVSCDVGDKQNGDGDWLIWSELELVGGCQYVKSAHYFSDEWPINFWNCEMDDAQNELAKIKEDGFDSIILVVPWREFQPEMQPVSYNEYAINKLSELMKMAETAGLDVVLRVGYTWDYYKDDKDVITDRFYQLTGDTSVSDAWYAYVKKIYDTVASYSNFKGAFLTWEDFWNNLNVCSANLSEKESVDTASFMGYQNFVKNHYTLENFNQKYGTSYASFDEIKIPTLKDPDMYAFYEYYDDFLNTILVNSQKVFPNLSMEVRIDGDVTVNAEGNTEYYYHDSTYACGSSDMTTVMYGIPMGFENKGERVSAEEAMEKTDYILSKLSEENDEKNVYVDQFIYADNTPKFKDNAQIKTEELGDYLTKVYRILKRTTWGYGVWTYRNYCANMLYNPQFALNTDGWKVQGDAKVEKIDGSNKLRLSKGACVSQNIPAVRNQFPAQEYVVEFDIQIETSCPITLQTGEDKKELIIPESGTYYIKFIPGETFDFSFLAKEECVIDNVKLYSQVQEGLLYDDQGFELNQIENIRKLNEKLAR